MKVKTGKKSGLALDNEAAVETAAVGKYPPFERWYGGWRCKGTRDWRGNITNATCQLAWPARMQPPV